MKEKKIKQKILDETNKLVKKYVKQSKLNSSKIERENKVLRCFVNESDIQPRICAEKLTTEGEHITGYDVIEALRFLKLTIIKDRTKMIKYADEICELIYNSLAGDNASFEKLEQALTEKDKWHKQQARLVLLRLFEKYPELYSLPCYNDILIFGDIFCKFCLFDLISLAGAEFGLDTKAVANKDVEQLEKEIIRVTDSLISVNNMLEELQDDFEERLEASKIQEKKEFFSLLNSEKYGFFLDCLLTCRSGLEKLTKENYEFPVEISSLSIMLKKLIEFIKDCEINPIMKVGKKLIVKASEIDDYEYYGTPFEDEDDEKAVEVISPGWAFAKNKDIQISKPKIREMHNK